MLVAPLGLTGYLLWVGNRMGNLAGYFALQKGAWGHTFDYGKQTADVFSSMAVGRFDYLFAFPFEDTIAAATVLLAALVLPFLIRLRPPAVLIVYTLLTLALVLGSQQIFGNVSRYLLPCFPLFIPPAMRLRTVGLPTLCLVLGSRRSRRGPMRGTCCSRRGFRRRFVRDEGVEHVAGRFVVVGPGPQVAALGFEVDPGVQRVGNLRPEPNGQVPYDRLDFDFHGALLPVGRAVGDAAHAPGPRVRRMRSP